jgi:hypothetical protein
VHGAIATSRYEHFLDVETHSELARSMTVVDRLNVAAKGCNRVAWASTLAAGRP